MRFYRFATAAVLTLVASASAGDSWLQIGGQVRGRFDDPQGIGYNPDVSNAYYVERIRLDIMVRPVAQLRFYVQAQDSRPGGYDNRAAMSSMQNPVDMRQGYVDCLSNESSGVQVRIGRQEMRLGAGRLVDSPDWSNVSRVMMRHGWLFSGPASGWTSLRGRRRRSIRAGLTATSRADTCMPAT
jgi:hypothetical protein